MEHAGQDDFAHGLTVVPEESGTDHQEERGRDPPRSVPLGYAVERREPALRIFRRGGVRDIFFPLLIRLVLVALVEESPRERTILRIVRKDPLRTLDSLGALDASRIP
jgi:hypothetical protein